jgi:hypothetical protein
MARAPRRLLLVRATPIRLLVVVQPLRTETLPQSKRNGLEGPDPITALRIRDESQHGRELLLPDRSR